MQNKFADGIRDGIPIALGYFSVSFAFGMTALTQGVPLWAAVAISFTCLTSAGQFAGLTIIAASGSLIEMALSQFVINLRYFLMSLSLTQKVDPQMPRPQRAIISFGITDEIFALSSSRYNGVGFRYMVGLMTLPIAAWTLGTLCGGVASGLLRARRVGHHDLRHVPGDHPAALPQVEADHGCRGLRLAAELSVCAAAGLCAHQQRIRHHHLHGCGGVTGGVAVPGAGGEHMMQLILYIAVMAAVTYLIRCLPLVCFSRRIKSRFLQSFLYYVPYAVLGAMTFPAVFTSGGALIPSCIGTLTAVILAWRGKSLLMVAAAASLAVYLAALFC